MFPLIAMLLTAAPAAPAPSAQTPSEADALFRKGRDLFKAGNLAEACPLFEKSYSLDPALGTLLNLAECYEKAERLVLAYLRFNDAASWAERVHESKREAVAREHVASVKARLSWLALSTQDPVADIVASVGDFNVGLKAVPESVPVDAGEVTVNVHAPGHRPWSTHLTIGRGEVRPLVVPPLAPEAMALTAPPAPTLDPAQVTPAPLTQAPTPAVTASAPARGSHAPGGAIALVAVGATAAIAGGAGIAWSLTTYGQLQNQQPGGPNQTNPTVTVDQLHTMQWLYPASWVAAGVGLAAAAGGSAWLLGGHGASVALIPSSHGTTFALFGSF